MDFWKAVRKVVKGILVVPAVWEGMKNAGKDAPAPPKDPPADRPKP